MAHQFSSEDCTLRQRLESLELPPVQFSHRLHLQLAYIYLCENSQEAAFNKMRDWTFRYLAHHQVDPAKYNETLTRAWMLAVTHFMQRSSDCRSSEEFLDYNPILLDSSIMLTHYSQSHLFSEQARQKFVEPDLDPIPRYPDQAA